MKQEAIDI